MAAKTTSAPRRPGTSARAKSTAKKTPAGKAEAHVAAAR
jgi:hypothetical protein